MKFLCHIRDTEQQLELDTDNMLIEIYWWQNTRNNGDMQNWKDWVQDNLSRLKLETSYNSSWLLYKTNIRKVQQNKSKCRKDLKGFDKLQIQCVNDVLKMPPKLPN